MTDAELIALAVQVRAAQKSYFKLRTKEALINSKELEARFDKAVQVRVSTPPGPAEVSLAMIEAGADAMERTNSPVEIYRAMRAIADKEPRT